MVKTWSLFRVGLGVAIQKHKLGVQMVKGDKNHYTVLACDEKTAIMFCANVCFPCQKHKLWRVAVKQPKLQSDAFLKMSNISSPHFDKMMS